MASLEQFLCDLRRTSPKGGAAPSAVIEKVREWKGMGESMLNSLATSLLDIDSREEKLNLASEALEAQWRGLKEKERQLELLDAGKRVALKFMEEKLKSKEERLKSKEEELDKQLKSKEEKLKSKEEDLDKQLKSVSEEIESLEVQHDEVFRLKIKGLEKLKEIERREKELDMMKRSTDERLGEIEKREKEFDAYCDEKSRELTLKEEVLVREKREFDTYCDEKSRDMTLKEEVLVRKKREFDAYRDEKSREMTLKEEVLVRKKREFDAYCDEKSREMTLKEEVLVREKREFDAYCDEKSGKLTLKEEVLVREKREFDEKIRLMSEEIMENQKAGSAVIIEMSKSALNSVYRMKGFLDDKLKEIESREMMAHKSLSAKFNEAELLQDSLEKRFKELEDKEKKLNVSQDDKTKTLESKECQCGTMRIDRVMLRGEKLTEQQKSGLQILEDKDDEKKRELELKQVNLVSCEMEHDYTEQDCGEKSLSSEKEAVQTCVKAKLVLDHLRGVELLQRLRGLEQPTPTTATNVYSSTNQEKSLDLTGALLNDKMTLEMAINGPEKDPELMGSLISEILSRSSDPAKVVLDIVKVFYANCSGKLDMECKQRRGRTILLLDQLAILSPNIQPFVTEAAIKLAHEWKSRMGSPMKNPMEALVFLSLVAAYKLSSHFDQEELFHLLMAAAKHKQTLVLCHTLGLVPRIPGYIQKLIHEKKFLLASTLVYEYQFQDRFPQADILNKYTAHARFLANKCRSQNNNLQGQKMAVGNEIAALRRAIKHIIQYGLESDYSPNALAARINQLEGCRASLRRRAPPSGQMQKQGKGWQKRYREAQLAQVVLDEDGESSSIPLNPRMASGASSSPTCAWTPKHQAMSQRETGGSSNHKVPKYSVPSNRHMGPYKRRRTDLWMNGGGLPVAQFVFTTSDKFY